MVPQVPNQLQMPQLGFLREAAVPDEVLEPVVPPKRLLKLIGHRTRALLQQLPQTGDPLLLHDLVHELERVEQRVVVVVPRARVRGEELPHGQRDARVVLPAPALAVEEEVEGRGGVHAPKVRVHGPEGLVQRRHSAGALALPDQPRRLGQVRQVGEVGDAPREDGRLQAEGALLLLLPPQQEGPLEAHDQRVLEAQAVGQAKVLGEVERRGAAPDVHERVLGHPRGEVYQVVLGHALALEVILQVDVLAVAGELGELAGCVALELRLKDLRDHLLGVVLHEAPLLEPGFVHPLTAAG